MAELIAEVGTAICDTAMVVTHDLDLTKAVADRVAILIDGRFAIVGALREVLAARDPAVQAFLAGGARP